jgi:murein DD-endopeptidase / murein LD-carboxypeptidase
MSNPTDCTKERFLTAVAAQRGVPFALQGRTPFVALDCVGIVVCCAEIAGLHPHYISNYSLNSDYSQTLHDLMEMNCQRISSVNEMEAGDIILFWLSNPTRPRHMGVLTHGEPGISAFNFVHTSINVKRVVENSLNPAWRDRIHSVWRFEELK